MRTTPPPPDPQAARRRQDLRDEGDGRSATSPAGPLRVEQRPLGEQSRATARGGWLPRAPAAVAQVRRGMPERGVLDLLGPPTEPLDLAAVSQALGAAGSGHRWRSGRRKLEVYLIDGRVAGTVAAVY